MVNGNVAEFCTVFFASLLVIGAVGDLTSLETESTYQINESYRANVNVMTQGELYLWTQYRMEPDTPETRRLAWAGDQGLTVWVDGGNHQGSGYTGPNLPSALINYFHQHNVKVVCRLWSDGGNVSLNNILHHMGDNWHGGSVDYQMSIGPEIDAFMIDECDQYNPNYYKAIAAYLRNFGKPMFVNIGGGNLQTSYQWADKVAVEFCWKQLIDWNADGNYGLDVLAAYPDRFIGVSKDYGYNLGAPWKDTYIYPVTADVPTGRPACGESSGQYYITLARAIWDTQWAWSNNIKYMSAIPDEYAYTPTWWGEYIEALLDTVASPTFNPAAGTYNAAQNVELSTVTADATIYYTTDGSTPDAEDTEYVAAVEVAETKTLKALAVKSGLTDSSVTTANYVINLPPSVPAPMAVLHMSRLMRD